MDERWLAEAIDTMRRIGNDTQKFEVKEAKGGLPKSTVETLSAFSNGAGGWLIFGISEKRGFTPVEGFDARKAQDALCSECERLTPMVRPMIAQIPFEGAIILAARIDEMHPHDKPCYITDRGMYIGSFVRSGDGDRRMSSYEVDRLMEEHVQPRYDDEIAEDSTLADLDPVLVEGFAQRQREMHPRILGAKATEDILLDLHVAKRTDEGLKPTMAGLLAMGMFPQRDYPRLNVTFTAFPGRDKSERDAEGKRFLDSQTIIGNIPTMIEDVLAAVSRNTRTGALIEGAFRKDVPDYPPVAVREAVANALMHRDYSHEARGSQVQVNLFVDRLEIVNPGGLYGDVTIDTLGVSGVSSSRNQFLSNILETTPYPGGGYVVENRGTGYQEIEDQLRDSKMPGPKPRNSMVSFSLTFDKRTVQPQVKKASRGSVDEAIIAYLSQHSSASTRELMEESGLGRTTVTNHINKLVEQGKVEPIEPERSPKQRYRLVR